MGRMKDPNKPSAHDQFKEAQSCRFRHAILQMLDVSPIPLTKSDLQHAFHDASTTSHMTGSRVSDEICFLKENKCVTPVTIGRGGPSPQHAYKIAAAGKKMLSQLAKQDTFIDRNTKITMKSILGSNALHYPLIRECMHALKNAPKSVIEIAEEHGRREIPVAGLRDALEIMMNAGCVNIPDKMCDRPGYLRYPLDEEALRQQMTLTARGHKILALDAEGPPSANRDERRAENHAQRRGKRAEPILMQVREIIQEELGPHSKKRHALLARLDELQAQLGQVQGR